MFWSERTSQDGLQLSAVERGFAIKSARRLSFVLFIVSPPKKKKVGVVIFDRFSRRPHTQIWWSVQKDVTPSLPTERQPSSYVDPILFHWIIWTLFTSLRFKFNIDLMLCVCVCRAKDVPPEVLRQREVKWLDMLSHWDKWMIKRFNKVSLVCTSCTRMI